MKGWGIYEHYRRQAKALGAEQHPKPQPAQPGSMEWLAEQKKSR